MFTVKLFKTCTDLYSISFHLLTVGCYCSSNVIFFVRMYVWLVCVYVCILHCVYIALVCISVYVLLTV